MSPATTVRNPIRALLIFVGSLSLLFVSICWVNDSSIAHGLNKTYGAIIALSIRSTDQFRTVNSNSPPPILDTTQTKTDSTQRLKAWEQQKPELLKQFRTNVYGQAPTKFNVSFRVESDQLKSSGLVMHRDTVSMTLQQQDRSLTAPFFLFRPVNSNIKAPVIVLINHRSMTHADPSRRNRSEFWPVEKLIAKGFATVSLPVENIDPDYDDGFENGIHGVFTEARTAESWGTIAAWAFAVRRVLDYLQTASAIDPTKIAVIGHSRGGKTSLWAAAQDPRIALVIANNSGCTGAALSRRQKGETLRAMNSYFPHWFCANYHKFNGRESELPIDQHQLLALIAPRRIYIASGEDDFWADPEGEFQSCLLANEAFEFYGKKGLTLNYAFPRCVDHSGHIAYHRRPGGHDLTRLDWDLYIQYMQQIWPNSQ